MRVCVCDLSLNLAIVNKMRFPDTAMGGHDMRKNGSIKLIFQLTWGWAVKCSAPKILTCFKVVWIVCGLSH
jgi:hypothetical protein